jgi:hypothetical protein
MLSAVIALLSMIWLSSEEEEEEEEEEELGLEGREGDREGEREREGCWSENLTFFLIFCFG